MKVAKRQQQGRGKTQKDICPKCGDEYLHFWYGYEEQKLTKKGVYCPKCDYWRKTI